MAVKCPKCHSENPETKQFCADCGTQLIRGHEPNSPEFGIVSPNSHDPRAGATETMRLPIHELTTGSAFAGRYQVIEELGHGGMGHVYKVFDTDIKEKIALKLLRPEVAVDKETVERFSNELKLARKISHRNVCRMFDLGKAEGTTFITMEFVPGEDLKKFIRKSGQLGAGRAVAIARQVAEGLVEAHRLGVVHRDLKPQNIMVDEDGNVRIMDFGIARSLKVKGITGAGVMIGTPEYMSPEQVEGKEVDSRSDIYSLGIVLYEMLTGRVPFEGDTPFTIGVKHKSELPRNPAEFNAQVPPDLGRLVLKCLEKDKSKRPQSADELKGALEKIEQGVPTTQRTVPARKTLASREVTVTLRLRKLFVPALAALAVVLAGVFLWHPWSRRGAVPPPPAGRPSIAVVYFENDTGDDKLDHWRKGIADLLITDLTQSKYLKVLGGDRLFTILSKLGQTEARRFSSEVLKEVAAQGGVNHIARGTYSKAGDILRIDLTLQDARSGEPVATHRVEGKGEESIFAMVDELTKWTKTSLNLSAEQVAGDISMKIGQVTTSSPEAYRLYSEGRQVFAAGQYQRSIEFMEKAIALDPGFAMAYASMGIAYGNLRKLEERRKYTQEALRLSDRLPEKEKLRIQGADLQSRLSTRDQAIALYEKLVSLYPDSDEAMAAHVNLGNLYRSYEDWDKSIEHYEAAIKAGFDTIQVFEGLPLSYMAKGEYQKAKEILEECAKRFPDRPRAHWRLGMMSAFQGQFDLALNEADKATAIDPTYTKARFYHLMWDFAQAEEAYKKWLGFISQQQDPLLARCYLEYLYRTLGRFEEAKNQIRLGLELAEQLKRDDALAWLYYFLAGHHLRAGEYQKALDAVEKPRIFEQVGLDYRIYLLEMKGRIFAEMGRMAEARKAANEIKTLVETSLYKKRIRHYDLLTGIIQLKEKDYPGAIASLKKAISLLPHPFDWESDDGLYMHQLAAAYYESGDLGQAREELEKMVAFIPGRYQYGDLYALGYYRLGLIHEKQGVRAKAKENYERFLDLWKAADPGQPEVADARKRLAALS